MFLCLTEGLLFEMQAHSTSKEKERHLHRGGDNNSELRPFQPITEACLCPLTTASASSNQAAKLGPQLIGSIRIHLGLFLKLDLVLLLSFFSSSSFLHYLKRKFLHLISFSVCTEI